jgi:hypothetical protein
LILEDLFIDVSAGKENVNDRGHRSRRVEIRASERLTCTTEFNVVNLRAQAHMALDSALDEMASVIDLYRRKVTVRGS